MTSRPALDVFLAGVDLLLAALEPPMPFVADYSGARPDPSAIKAAGYTGVVRYVAGAGKGISVGEWNQLVASGLSVTLVFEGAAQQAYRGAAGGTTDATAAMVVCDALGLPKSVAAAVYYVGDDPTAAPASMYPTIVAYFRAVVAVHLAHGGRRVGDYGSGPQINAVRAAVPAVTLEWAVRSWGLSAHTNLIQEQRPTMSTLGGQVDQNTVVTPDWGQWPPPGPVQVTRGAFMTRVAYDVNTGGTWAIEPNGAVYTADGAPYLGGLNQHPEWKAGSGTNLAVGIAPWSNGYVIVTHEDTDGTGDAFRYYRFSGTGPVAGTGPQGPPGVAGVAGPAGPAGAPGPAGPAGSSAAVPQAVLDDVAKLDADLHNR